MATVPGAPAAAAAVGYNDETFDSSINVGQDWFAANWDGVNPSAVNYTQNAGGGVTIDGGGDTWNAQLMTAEQTSSGWKGEAFGGGAYIQATISWTGAYSQSGGWPSFWSDDIESIIGSAATQWQGQATGFDNWLEADFMEYWSNSTYGEALHNWYGMVGSGANVSTNVPQFTLPAGESPSTPHTYGFLWVPATATTQGTAEWFFDGQQVGSTVHWNQYNPASPPPPVNGSTAYSVLDSRHLALILGTSANNPMTVSNVQVWQANSANDIFSGVPAPTTTSTPSAASANDTVLQAGATGSITDGSGNAWTLVNGVVDENGQAAGYSADVTRIAYVNGTVWQENTWNDWYSWTGTTWSTGTTTSPLPAPAPDTLTLDMSEDAYQGDAQFTVSVNGTQVGGTLTASALHATGDGDVFTLTGDWGANAKVKISFINDLYAGTPSTDRNLYVNSINYDGSTYAGGALMSNGSLTVTAGTSPATAAPADTITLQLAEDAYQGNADFELTIDGKQITTPQAVTTLYSSGGFEDFTFAGDLGAGNHTIGITFTNDLYAGTASTDRNLYVNGINVNGTHYGTGVTALYSTSDTATYAISTTH